MINRQQQVFPVPFLFLSPRLLIGNSLLRPSPPDRHRCVLLLPAHSSSSSIVKARSIGGMELTGGELKAEGEGEVNERLKRWFANQAEELMSPGGQLCACRDNWVKIG